MPYSRSWYLVAAFLILALPAGRSLAQAAPAETPVLVNNIFADSDLRQALSDVAAQTGVPIIPDSTVQGAISVSLKNQPLERALTMMLQPGGYAFAKLEGYYLVGAPDPTNPNFYLLTKNELVTLRYASPQAVISLLYPSFGRYLSLETAIAGPAAAGQRGNRSSANASLYEVAGMNGSPAPGEPPSYRLMITAPPSMLARIKAEIDALDLPPAQVMLEASVIELSQEALKNLGIDWATRWLRQDLTSGGPNLIYSTVANTEIAQVTALLQNGKARLRANPRVATADGRTAQLEVGREDYFQIVTGPLNYQTATLEKITSGILLRITPHIIAANNEVAALVEPSVRDVTGKGNNGLPMITFRNASTTLRVRDGESIIIGGLNNEFTERVVRKVPILGDVPLVGPVFRREESRSTKDEVVIIITPHIIRDGVPATNISPALQQEIERK